MSDLATQQQMMRFAALAYAGSTTAPSGELPGSQVTRITAGITAQLPKAAPRWSLTWVGLTQDRANLAFVARSTADAGTAVVALRGTVLSILDIIEDLDVQTMVAFDVGGPMHGNVSRGAMEAFTATVMGTDLAAALASVAGLNRIYVTGHSLGGALVTMVAPYLVQRFPGVSVLPFTFAAPTAGDEPFATSFNQQFRRAQCLFNRYDVIPYAWSQLVAAATGMFPNETLTVRSEAAGLILAIDGLLPDTRYEQPAQQPYLNGDYRLHRCSDDPAYKITTLAQWFEEAGFQHLLSTYLRALGTAPLADDGPIVTSMSPDHGPSGGGSSLILVGTGLTNVSHVDFGVVPARDVHVDDSTKRITATSPPGAGSVDVTVTTTLGTSVGYTFAYRPR